MIAKSYIEKNLKEFDRRFLASRTQKEPLYFSKLAVLELCGWIELSIDDLVRRSVRKGVQDLVILDNFEDKVIQKNYGFHYSKNFRPILCAAIGEILVAKVERLVDPLQKQRLESELNTLTKNRNSLAHTYLKGITHQIDAPSRTIARYGHVYAGLKAFEKRIFENI